MSTVEAQNPAVPATADNEGRKRRVTPRTLDVRFLVGSLVLVALVLASLAGIRWWQVSRTSRVFLERASAYESQEEFFKAAEFIKRYLQLNPQAAEQRVELARVYTKGVQTYSQRQQAINLFYLALGAGITDEEISVRRELCGLLLINNRNNDAVVEGTKILEREPADAEALRVVAIAKHRQFESGALAREDAAKNRVVESLKRARETNPNDIEVALLLANAYRNVELCRLEIPDVATEQRHAFADESLNQLVKTKATDPDVYLTRHFYRAKWNLKGADEDLAKALELAPDNPAVLMTAAQDAQRQGQRAERQGGDKAVAQAHYERAVNFYEKVLRNSEASTDPLPRVQLGETLLALGRKDDAIRVWKQGLEVCKQTPLLFHCYLANIALDQNNLADAELSLLAVEKEMMELPPNTPRNTRLTLQRDQSLRRGMWLLKKGDIREGLRHLRDVTLRQEQLGGDSPQSTRAWLLIGNAYATLEEWTDSALAFDNAALQQPKLAIARVAAAESWLAGKRIDLAVSRGEQGVGLQPSCQAWYVLAAALFQQQMAYAVDARSWLRFEEALGETLRRVDDGTLTDSWQAVVLQADYLLARNNSPNVLDAGQKECLELLQKAEKRYASSIPFWRALPLIYQRLSEPDQAAAACDHLARLKGGEGEAILARSRLLCLQSKYADAEKLLGPALRGDAPLDASLAQRELVNVKIAQRQFEEVRPLLISLVGRFPQDLSLWRRLADVDLELHRFTDFSKWREGMQNCGPSGEILARYYQVRATLAQAESAIDPALIQATEEQAKLVSERPHWAEAVALKGMLDQRRGRADAAIEAYERAITLGEQRLMVFEQLINLLERANRSTDAEKYLNRLKSHVPFSQDLTEFESTVEIRRNQPAQAVDVARRGVERRPDDASARVWLGRMLLVNNKLAEAETEFETAVKLTPDDVRAWNGLFSYYLRIEQPEKSRQVLTRMAKTAKLTDAERHFILAQGYELLGDLDTAEKEYRQSQRVDPENVTILLRMAGFFLNSNPDEAQQCLRRVLKIEPNSGVARRTLAALLASRGKEEDWKEVERLLSSATVRDDVLSSQDQRLQAVLLAQRGGAENYNRAVAILEELINRPEQQIASDRLLLAQLYEKQSRIIASEKEAQRALDRAREQYVSLCAKSTPQPSHLVSFAEFLLRHQQREEVNRWLDRYRELLASAVKPTPVLIVEYVRLRIASMNVPAAEEWLEKLEAMEPDALPTITLRARVMALQGKGKDIEARTEPAAAKLLGKATEAQQRAAVLQGIGNLYVSVEKYAAAEKWYRQLYEEFPSAFEPVLAVLARQGRFNETILLARQVAAKYDSAQVAITLAGILASNKAEAPEARQAEDIIEAALDKHPRDLRLLLNVATLRVVQGRTEDAVKMFRRVVDLSPRNVVALNNLATLLSDKAEQRQEALRLIDKAIEITGSEAALYDTKGTILIYDGQAERAIEFLKLAVDGPDRDPRYRFHLAIAYKEINEINEAKSELEKALKQNLEKQILTPSELKMLNEMKTILAP